LETNKWVFCSELLDKGSKELDVSSNSFDDCSEELEASSNAFDA